MTWKDFFTRSAICLGVKDMKKRDYEGLRKKLFPFKSSPMLKIATLEFALKNSNCGDIKEQFEKKGFMAKVGLKP